MICFFFLTCCTSTSRIPIPKINFIDNTILYIGSATGGIVENENMEGIGSNNIDAISGSTYLTINTGLHQDFQTGKNSIETGLDYIFFNQKILVTSTLSGFSGGRDFIFHQFRIPLTYNFNFIKNEEDQYSLIIKTGASLGYTFNKSVSDSGSQPLYDFYNWDIGPTLGITYYPYINIEKIRTGLYIDLYRGTRIYKDDFHFKDGFGGHSYIKFGICFIPSF